MRRYGLCVLSKVFQRSSQRLTTLSLSAIALASLVAITSSPTATFAWSSTTGKALSIGASAGDYNSVSASELTSDGGFVAVGNVSGETDLDPSSGTSLIATGATQKTGFVAWYNADGALVQGFDLGTSAQSRVTDVAIVSDIEMVVIVGQFNNGSIDLDPGPGTDTHTAEANTSRHFIAAYEVDMTPVWTHSWVAESLLSTPPMPTTMPLLEPTSSKLIVGSTVNSTGSDLNPDPNTTDNVAAKTGSPSFNAFIASFNFDGAFNFAKVFESDTLSEIYSLAVSDNAIVAAGNGNGTIDLDPDGTVTQTVSATAPNRTPFIVSLDSNGDYSWHVDLLGEQTVGSPGMSGARITMTADGSVIAVGSFTTNTNFDNTPCPGAACFVSGTTPDSNGDAYVVKYNNAGLYQSHFTIASSGQGPDNATSVTVDDDNNIIVLATLMATDADLDPGSGSVMSKQGYNIIAYGGTQHNEYLWSTTTMSIPNTVRHIGDRVNMIIGGVNGWNGTSFDLDPSASRTVTVPIHSTYTDGLVAFIDAKETSTETTTTTTIAATTTTIAATTTTIAATTTTTQDPGGVITGEVWTDTNNDNQRDDDEGGVEGATVELVDTDIDPVLTDGDGNFEFTNVTPGDYELGVTPPAGVDPESIAVRIVNGVCGDCTVTKRAPVEAQLPTTGNDDRLPVVLLVVSIGLLGLTLARRSIKS